MEETEPGKEWFITRGADQFGPMTFDVLKKTAEDGELNPRLDMVWKNGMSEWIPAGQLEGLFVRNKEAEAAELAKNAFTEYQPELSEKEKKRIKGEWTGTGRGTFLFVIYILPLLWLKLLPYGVGYLAGKMEPDLLNILKPILYFAPIIIILSALMKRFENLTMTRWWFLGLFIPILNLWVWYRLFACPPGYAYHGKLDPIGWALALIHWLGSLLMVASLAFAAYTLTQAPEDDAVRIVIEGYLEKFEETRKAP